MSAVDFVLAVTFVLLIALCRAPDRRGADRRARVTRAEIDRILARVADGRLLADIHHVGRRR